MARSTVLTLVNMSYLINSSTLWPIAAGRYLKVIAAIITQALPAGSEAALTLWNPKVTLPIQPLVSHGECHCGGSWHTRIFLRRHVPQALGALL